MRKNIPQFKIRICRKCNVCFDAYPNTLLCLLCKRENRLFSKRKWQKENYDTKHNSAISMKWRRKKGDVYAHRPWAKYVKYAKDRCNSKDRKYYFQKGIKCFLTVIQAKEIWFRDKAFLLKRPSIDRIDSDKNYEFSNCRFIEQSLNTRARTKP